MAEDTKGRRRYGRRNRRLNTELLEAVEEGDVWKVDRCLQHGASANATCGGVNTSVCHLAALKGSSEVLGILLNYGASPRVFDTEGRSPLHLAAWTGDAATMRVLLDKVGDMINTRTTVRTSQEPVQEDSLDSRGHNHETLKKQLPHTEPGSTPLHVACQRVHLECIQMLLAAGANKDALDDCGMSCFDVIGEKLVGDENHLPASKRLPEVIRVLLEAGAKPSSTVTTPRTTCMHTAVALECPEAVKELEALSRHGQYVDRSGCTPMHLAVSLRLQEPLKALLHCYIDRDSEADSSASRSYSAEANPVDERDSSGNTSLHYAISTQWFAGVEIFLEAGADVCEKNSDGATSLHLAAQSGNLDILEEILNISDCRREVVHAIQSPKLYLADWESWLKWICFALSAIVATVDHDVNGITWPRHVTTAAILLVWTEYMFLLCRDPDWGYCVLMFTKVAINVFKVISIFAFLIIGFAFAFMVEFQTVSPFSSPFDSFVKTVVMMTNELDYSGIFDNGKLSSPVYARIIFLCFVFLVSIVLMNLLVGIAVADITNLEAQGKTNRLRKQVDFASTMERILYYGGLLRCLHSSLKNKKGPLLEIYPGRPRRKKYKGLPRALTDTLIKHAFEHKKSEIQYTMQDLFNKMDAISKAPVFSSPSSNTIDVDDIVKKLNELILEISQQLKDKKIDDATAFLDLKSGTSLFREDVSGRIDRLQLDMRGMLTVMKKVLNYVSPQGHVVDIGQHSLLRNTPKLSSC
ncbi:transient receptor potential channel pyrexia-like isoform X2 [Periplaneta americana]|uniref:transient receptor potential channel pyrexia-like isoform X2 n=1 Tax=Periplaneta americana TaxID=6978 RepID=UPI0037E8A763